MRVGEPVNKIMTVILMSVFILFGIVSIVGGAINTTQINKKLEYYEMVEAKIIDCRFEVKKGRKGLTKRYYYHTYAYEVDGKEYEYESPMSSTSQYTGTRNIYYDPANPAKAITLEVVNNSRTSIVAGAFFIAVGAIVLVVIGRTSPRNSNV